VILLDNVAATGTSAPTNIGDAKTCFIHVYSASTSTATVKIQQSLGNNAWHTVATITNPTAEGELWKGPSLPLTRVTISAYTAGHIYANADFANAEVTTWEPVDAVAPTTGTFGIIKKTWTNAEIVTAGTGGTSATIDVGVLPAGWQLLSAYIIVGTQATFAAGTLTMGVGRTGATYVDFLAASDLKAAAATVYGNAAAERATDAAIQYGAAAATVKAIITAGAGDLANVTTSTGTIYLLYVVYP
jgi:hypothetical protein